MDNQLHSDKKSGIFFNREFAYLSGTKAAVVVGDSTKMVAKPEGTPKSIGTIPSGVDKTLRGFVPWGKNNKLPSEVLEKVRKSEIISSNLEYLIMMTYGEGIETGVYERDAKGNKIFVPKDFPQFQEFEAHNDLAQYQIKSITDLRIFFQGWAEILINKDRKAVGLSHKACVFSRVEAVDEAGNSNHHFYSSLFKEGKTPTGQNGDVIVTRMLDAELTVLDAKMRMGYLIDRDGKTKDKGDVRLVVPIYFPTADMEYYARPYWWSIFESGWFDFAVAIPKFKSAIMTNQATLKYEIILDHNYFENIFASEKITDEKAQIERIKKEYKDLNNFLSNAENSGKSVVSFRKVGPNGDERSMEIKVIENHFKGGEYVEDVEESANVLSYAQGVHPSIRGAAPGKSKTINGTEARELFLIGQILSKPMRDIVCKPYYVIKAINKWDEKMQFRIPNYVLTTLDKNPTGTQQL